MSIENKFIDSLFTCCCVNRKKDKYNLLNYKIIIYNKSDDVCSICLEDLKKNIIILPKCHHKFHEKCIFDWFERDNSEMKCPLCKTSYIEYDDF